MRRPPQGSHTGARRRVRGTSWMLCALAAATLGFVPSAQAAKKPDLVISTASLEGNGYAFQGESGGMFTHEPTRNRGSARAGPSITRAWLRRGKDFQLGSRAVPGLGVAKQSAGDDEQPGNK